MTPGDHFLYWPTDRELIDAVPYGADGELDEVSWLDRLWFEGHPTVHEYYLKPHPIDVRMHAAEGRTLRRVRVLQLAPGVHTRQFLTVNGARPTDAAHGGANDEGGAR